MSGASQRGLLEYDDVPYKGIIKVISGGQDGADLGGLVAAYECGIETGGHCPRFWKTSSGPNTDLRDIFHLEETQSTGYPKRTELNVKNSDGTIRFASNFATAGEVLTLKFIEQYQKTHFSVLLSPANEYDIPQSAQYIFNWVVGNSIRVLNVAGNRDDIRRGYHYHQTLNILKEVFSQLEKWRSYEH